jgi:uncharacterized membrane protein YjjP (DUF1212 family)
LSVPIEEENKVKAVFKDVLDKHITELLNCGVIVARGDIEKMLSRLDRIVDSLDKLLIALGEREETLDKILRKENPFSR